MMNNAKNTCMAIVALAAASAVGLSQAAETGIDSRIDQDWSESALTVALPGGASNTLKLGDYYQVLVTAQEEGHLYLVQQNSQERASDKLRLAPVLKKIPGYSGGNAFMYPSGDSLEAAPPLGAAEVGAIYSSTPLALSTLRVSLNDQGEYQLSWAQLEALLAEARRADPSLRLAVKSLGYEVAMAEGELEFTTRGIARQINTAITSEDLNPEDGILTSFDAHIQFEFGSAEPTLKGQLQLDAFGDVLTRDDFAHIQFVVAGHTDDVGDRAYNLDLSEARAIAVADYLQFNYGIESNRIIIEALGEDAPYVDNSDTASRAQNRRVEFMLLD